jgi:hypothetical protein
LVSDGGFGEGLQWGFGYATVKESIEEVEEEEKSERRRKSARSIGFAVKSAEIMGSSILIRAINAWNRPARISTLVLTEIWPETKRGLLLSKDRESLRCEWRVRGFNLANPGEIITAELIPSRPLREGYAYEIAVGRGSSSEELDEGHGIASAHVMGSPTAFVYRNGRLEQPQKSRELLTTETVSLEHRFCINCGIKISGADNYCPSCGAKQ